MYFCSVKQVRSPKEFLTCVNRTLTKEGLMASPNKTKRTKENL